MDNITVAKIGGNVVDNRAALEQFARDFASLQGPKILIHGGGKEATRLSAALGIETKMISGRRVTDRETLDVVTMVYAGAVNKRVVSLLQANGCNALGLSGADGNAVRATLRRPEPIDYGYVGDIDPANVNAPFIATLLQAGITPVFCAIMHDGGGTLLNCNADSVASAVAIAATRIAPTRLVFCFEKPGVLSDVNDPTSVIRYITPDTYRSYVASGMISDGMIPKVDNAFNAIRAGVDSVIIKDSKQLLDDNAGTIIAG